MTDEWYDKYDVPPPKPSLGTQFLSDGVLKFDPHVDAPTEPQTVSQFVPQESAKMTEQTYQVILNYNNGLSYFKASDSYTVEAKGVVIHKITEQQAIAISERIKPVADQYELPLTYALACLAIESTLDPNCINQNKGPGESNPTDSEDGFDCGIAQLKLKYLIGQSSTGVTTVDEAMAFALDVNKAIPYFASLMASHVIQAQNIIDENKSSVPDPRFSNVYMSATAIYNEGLTGFTELYESGQYLNHCVNVQDLEEYFAKALGVKSIFSALS